MESAENQPNRGQKQQTDPPVYRRPAEAAEPANDHIDQNAMPDVESEERHGGAGQTKITNEHEGQPNVNDGGSNFGPEKNGLHALCQDDESHGPGDDTERHSKTYPTQRFHRGQQTWWYKITR